MSAPGKIIDATPPANADAEMAVLGSMILNFEAIDIAASILKPEFFFHERHQHLFSAIVELRERQVPVDYTTLIEETRRRRQLELVGGPGYITSLEAHVYTTDNVAHHASIVLHKYQLRQLISITEQIQEQALDERDEVKQILNHAQKLILDLSEGQAAKEFQSMGDLTLATVEEIDKLCSAEHAHKGLATGFAELDNMTGGFQKNDLIILAARPSVGKTALALNLALNIGAGVRHRQIGVVKPQPVGIFSLEMSANQVNQRMLSSLAEVSMLLMREGKVSARGREKLHKVAKQLYEVPIYVDDSPGISVIEVRAKARRLQAMQPDLGLIIIDYLQLMRGAARSENRQQEVAEITRSLKALARELKIPILALSQLSRLVEQRKGKSSKPMLSDLRESGAIEQDADVVMFLHRDMKANAAEDGNDRAPTQETELIIGKQRNGPVGTIDIVFFKDTATFHNLARVVDAGGPRH
jgi:replicative DNA helicase